MNYKAKKKRRLDDESQASGHELLLKHPRWEYGTDAVTEVESFQGSSDESYHGHLIDPSTFDATVVTQPPLKGYCILTPGVTAGLSSNATLTLVEQHPTEINFSGYGTSTLTTLIPGTYMFDVSALSWRTNANGRLWFRWGINGVTQEYLIDHSCQTITTSNNTITLSGVLYFQLAVSDTVTLNYNAVETTVVYTTQAAIYRVA